MVEMQEFKVLYTRCIRWAVQRPGSFGGVVIEVVYDVERGSYPIKTTSGARAWDEALRSAAQRVASGRGSPGTRILDELVHNVFDSDNRAVPRPYTSVAG